MVLIALPVAPLQAAVQTLVVPNEFANVSAEGVQNPFFPQERWLNIYNASELLSAMPEGGEINQISFRIDESDRDMFTATLPDIEIRMSTSPSLAPDLPVPFAEIVGLDEKVVFSRGSAQFSVNSSASGPNPSPANRSPAAAFPG